MQLWMRGRGAPAHQPPGRGQHRKMGTPGPEGSIGKLAFAELEQGHLRPSRRPHGRRRACSTASYEMAPPRARDGRRARLQKAFLRCRANSIEGGTSEVMRNILGERVLGLPGDVRVDKDVPGAVPRN